MGIERISLGEYLQMEEPEEMKILIENVKPNSIIRYKSIEKKPRYNYFWQMQWGELIQIREVITDNIFEPIEITHGFKLGALLSVPALNVFACFEWISEQLKALSEAENQRLNSKPTAKQIDAGIEDFQEFGYANSLRSLRGNDVTKDEALLKTPYGIIFRELVMNKTENQYNEAYSKLK